MQEPDRRRPNRSSLIWLVILAGLVLLLLLVLAAAWASLREGEPPRPSAAQRRPSSGTPVASATAAAPLAPQAGGRSAGDPYIPELGNTGYDVSHYVIQMALDPASPIVQAAVTVRATSTLAGLAELSLDFAGFEIASVTVDGLAAAYQRSAKKLVISLGRPLATGQAFAIRVAYQGTPTQEPSPYVAFVDHLGLHYPDGETLFAVAEPDGARYWFPANDHPRDKAAFRFELSVPEGLMAIANGELLQQGVSALPDGRAGELFIWQQDEPMAPYLALVAVGPYEPVDGRAENGMAFRHYALPGTRDDLAAPDAAAGQAMGWLSDRFGPYPFDSFGYLVARVPGASMETQTMVLLAESMIGPRTAVHELAHQWFGNWVSLESWGEMWRNEGLVTYVTLLWLHRNDPAGLESELANVRSAVAGNNQTYPLNDPPPEKLFEYDVYYEGALAVHDLRLAMGDEAFFAGLRLYLERYGGGTASDAEFEATMEEAAGRPLDAVFGRWFPR
jgi:aminopeptidase N